VTAQGYDQDGNRNSLTNGQANTTTFSFDLGDRLSSVTTASSLATLYGYNSRNLVATITKPSSQQTTNTYDAASHLVQLADPFATTAYNYDNDGRLTETDDNAYGQSRKTVRVYDSLGRLISYSDEAGNTISYGYDQAGNLTQLTYPGGKVVSYGYDANNRLSTVTDWAARTTTYSYDDNGRLVQTVYPNNTQENRSYDLSGKLTRIQDLDPSGNVIYSSVEQLDVTGRTIGEKVTPAPTSFGIPDATMTFDADNRLNNFNGQSVSFDADGNMTSGPSAITLNAIAYNYDARNRLTSAGNVSYNYNPDGRRTSLSDATLNRNGLSSTFVIDPNARLDRTLVRNKGGNATYYVYGLGLIGQEQSGIYQNYHFDSHGSTVAITDANGVVTDRFEYDSYGGSLNHTGTGDTPFQYNGKYGVQTDPNGLLYMRARYYNPAIRRFINQDVLFGDLNPGISLNRFAFANGNPVSLMDPFGLCAQDDDPSWTAEFCQIGGGLLEGLGTLAALPFTSGLKAMSDLQYIVKGQIPPSPTLQDLGNALLSDLSTSRGLGRLASGFIVGEGIGELCAVEGVAAESAETNPSTLYHYTAEANAASIAENGLLPGASGQVFTTTNGGLTPLQAQIELALSPNRGLPGAMFEIDAAGLREAGITPSLGPLRVEPTATAPGGGTEVIFNQQIPPQFLKRIW